MRKEEGVGKWTAGVCWGGGGAEVSIWVDFCVSRSAGWRQFDGAGTDGIGRVIRSETKQKFTQGAIDVSSHLTENTV